MPLILKYDYQLANQQHFELQSKLESTMHSQISTQVSPCQFFSKAFKFSSSSTFFQQSYCFHKSLTQIVTQSFKVVISAFVDFFANAEKYCEPCRKSIKVCPIDQFQDIRNITLLPEYAKDHVPIREMSEMKTDFNICRKYFNAALTSAKEGTSMCQYRNDQQNKTYLQEIENKPSEWDNITPKSSDNSSRQMSDQGKSGKILTENKKDCKYFLYEECILVSELKKFFKLVTKYTRLYSNFEPDVQFKCYKCYRQAIKILSKIITLQNEDICQNCKWIIVNQLSENDSRDIKKIQLEITLVKANTPVQNRLTTGSLSPVQRFLSQMNSSFKPIYGKSLQRHQNVSQKPSIPRPDKQMQNEQNEENEENDSMQKDSSHSEKFMPNELKEISQNDSSNSVKTQPPENLSGNNQQANQKIDHSSIEKMDGEGEKKEEQE